MAAKTASARPRPAAAPSKMGVLERGVAAACNLLEREFAVFQFQGTMAASSAHAQIENLPAPRRAAALYRELARWRRDLVCLLADAYRRYVRLALAHAAGLPHDPAGEAWLWLQPAVQAGVAEMRQWFMLACDGENESVRHIGTMAAAPGETVSLPIPAAAPAPPPASVWRAPSWAFLVFPAATGIGPIKTVHVPDANADGRLNAAFTRLIFGGACRLFLLELQSAAQRVRDEEIAAAAAVPVPPVVATPRRPNKRGGWEHKEKLLAAIRDVLATNPRLAGSAFCAELDRHHAPPLPAWEKSGEWDGLTFKAAWKRPGLRRKIRRVRQEAIRPRC